MKQIGNDAAAVFCARPERVRSHDTEYAFRQHSDVLYLSGFAEPEAVLVLRPGAASEKFVMFVRPRDPEMETWNGRRAGLEGARERFGADAAYPFSELGAKLGELICNVEELHYQLGEDAAMDALIASNIAVLRRSEKRGKRPPRAVVDPRSSLHELRLIKGPDEVTLLQKAADNTAEAHLAAMRLEAPGCWEHELEAVINYTFRRRGGSGGGYNSIVGAGVNATILHYIENNTCLRDGDLVLIDAGCEVEGYTADVTRTWPASGTFTAPQRELYDVVLAAQLAAIAMARPGATIEAIHQHTIARLTEGMVKLGLLAGPLQARIDDKSFRKYYMHGTSHWLGMDVHDVGAYTIAGTPRPLAPGMVITVEPGLYVAADDDTAPAAYRGLGIRIEDDILITADGNVNLTAAIPKTVADVEAACRRPTTDA
ncbi:MAG: aminopeptidase P N-terminal domain-containing protein [Myxococcales bacterium]|nr:aminopeptidase P N-terminal domain-containing protein [Myxococcales bacterium]